MNGEQRRGLQAALIAYTGWGLLTLYWKQLAGFDPIDLVGWRITTASVVLVAWLAVTRKLGDLRDVFQDRATLGNVVVAAVLLTINWSTYVWAVVNGHVIDTALGYFLAPLATMAIGVIVLGERLTPLKWVSIGFAVLAIVVLVVSYGEVPWVAIVLAATWTSYGFVKRRVALEPLSSLTAEMLVLIVPALIVVAISFTKPDGIPHEAVGAEWALVLGTGLITAAPLLLFAYAAKRVPFTILGPTNYLIPAINFLIGWLIYNEDMPPSRVVGFTLVWLALACIAVETLVEHRSSRDVPDPQLIDLAG